MATSVAGASQLWFRLQLQLEEARYAGVGVVGAIADLEKAFNLLPRTPVMAAARAVGIAEPILVGWCGALSAMRRRFRIRGSVGPGLHSCTGFPEGCGLSCLAMALVDLSLHSHVSRVCPQMETLTYVDNWEVQAKQVSSLLDSHRALVDFTRAWDLRLDESKTLMWGTDRRDRRTLRSLGTLSALTSVTWAGMLSFPLGLPTSRSLLVWRSCNRSGRAFELPSLRTSISVLACQ